MRDVSPAWARGPGSDKSVQWPTGTGARGATVDNAILWPPGGPPILVAAYLSGSDKPIKALEAALADMGRLVAATFG